MSFCVFSIYSKSAGVQCNGSDADTRFITSYMHVLCLNIFLSVRLRPSFPLSFPIPSSSRTHALPTPSPPGLAFVRFASSLATFLQIGGTARLFLLLIRSGPPSSSPSPGKPANTTRRGAVRRPGNPGFYSSQSIKRAWSPGLGQCKISREVTNSCAAGSAGKCVCD